jgi:hypothetical protein
VQAMAGGTLRCVLDVDAHVRKVAASGRIAPSPKLTSASRDFSTPDSTRDSTICGLCLVDVFGYGGYGYGYS